MSEAIPVQTPISVPTVAPLEPGSEILIQGNADAHRPALIVEGYGELTHVVSIIERAKTGKGSALNLVSENTELSCLQITGHETAKGTIKITHLNPGPEATSDNGAAAISIDLQNGGFAGTEAQGIFLTSTLGPYTGPWFQIRNTAKELLYRILSSGAVLLGPQEANPAKPETNQLVIANVKGKPILFNAAAESIPFVPPEGITAAFIKNEAIVEEKLAKALTEKIVPRAWKGLETLEKVEDAKATLESQEIGVRVEDGSNARLRGVLKTTAKIPSGTKIFKLPAGTRPLKSVFVTSRILTINQVINLEIRLGGEVFLETPAELAEAARILLDGLTWNIT